MIAPLILVRLLLATCLGIACYLAGISVFGDGAVAGCGGAFDCNRVLASRWGYWLGLPVSLLGAVNYLGMLLLLVRPQWLLGAGFSPRTRWTGLAVLALCLLGAAAWFVGVQVYLKAFCAYCTTAHVLGAVAAFIVLGQAGAELRVLPNLGNWTIVQLRHPLSRMVLGASAGALLLLIAGQMAGRTSFFRLSARGDDDLYRISDPSGGARIITLPQAGVQTELAQWPLIGPATARTFFLSFYDYTCEHCREMHPRIVDAQNRLGASVAIVSLPTPLNAECNRAIDVTLPGHEDACRFARLALALWLLDQEKFREFDDWMFASYHSRDEVEAYARNLVDAARLEQALQNPRINQQIELATQIYAVHRRKFNQLAMPQLLIGRAFVTGTVPTVERLLEIVREHSGRADL